MGGVLMATGGIWINGDGTRSINPAGKQIVDDNCVQCCCVAKSYKVAIAGITLATCPIPNGMGSLPNAPGCFKPGVNNLGGDLCMFLVTGTLPTTFYLPQVSVAGNSCVYQLQVHPSPLQVVQYANDCVTKIRDIDVTLTISLQFDRSFVGGPTTGVEAGIGLSGPSPDTTGNLRLELFNGALATGENTVCGILCPMNVIPNNTIGAIYFWVRDDLVHLATGFAVAGLGGTVTFTPQ